LVLVASIALYFRQTQEFLNKFPEVNRHLTSDIWKEKYVLKDLKLVVNNFENTSVGILDNDGLLNMTGWTYANKMNAKKKKVSPVLWGNTQLSYTRFKHIDFYNFDIGEFNLRITGFASGLHRYMLGMYRVEFFNWKTKDYVQHEAYVTPFDTYAFRDGTVNFRKIHFRRNGLEVSVYRSNHAGWVVGIEIKLANPKIVVDGQMAEFPGISHVDSIDGKDKAYWLRRYGNLNCPVRHGVYKMKNKMARVTESNFNTDFKVIPSMYYWQIKGMYPYKPFAYLRAGFQTKNLDQDPNEKNPRKRSD